METILDDDQVKIVKVAFAAGTNMPRHVATSDACLVVEEGIVLLIYAGEVCELNEGSIVHIPANQQHMLKVVTDFKGYIILTEQGKINYPNTDIENVNLNDQQAN
jgi:quercetin dioxygenase-like cupin family protein